MTRRAALSREREMSRYPNVCYVDYIIAHANDNAVATPEGYIPARPLGFQSFLSRCHCAWMVFTGRADALVWGGGQ